LAVVVLELDLPYLVLLLFMLQVEMVVLEGLTRLELMDQQILVMAAEDHLATHNLVTADLE
jgi:hypothetical protein